MSNDQYVKTKWWEFYPFPPEDTKEWMEAKLILPDIGYFEKWHTMSNESLPLTDISIKFRLTNPKYDNEISDYISKLIISMLLKSENAFISEDLAKRVNKFFIDLYEKRIKTGSYI